MKRIAEFLIIGLLLYGGVSVAGALDWPQWRGPNRDGISRQTGLLKEWPDGGPQVLWRVPLGEGFSGISVARGRVYTMFSEGNDEFVICLDASNGEEMWRFRSDSTYYEYEGGNGPRATPTIDEEFLFTVSAQGRFYALSSVNGEKVWSYDLIKDFGSYMPKWGFSSSPLVEGNLLLVEVGGNNGKFIVAFDKTNGDVLWSSHTDKLGYASPIGVTIGGVRQLIASQVFGCSLYQSTMERCSGAIRGEQDGLMFTPLLPFSLRRTRFTSHQGTEVERQSYRSK